MPKLSPLRFGSETEAAFLAERFRKSLLDWYDRHGRSLPWREHWRKTRSPWGVWVSEIMLQQTVIKAVIPVYLRFMDRFPTVHEFALADEASVRESVRGLGYYRRFRMLHEGAKLVGARLNDGERWPVSAEKWQEIPGIGAYTSAALSSITADFPAAVVDGNVERVFCRLLDIRRPPNEPDLKKRFWGLAQQWLEVKRPGDFNQAVMELGQTLCTPTSPKCGECPVNAGCLAFQNQSQHLAPAAKKRKERVDVEMALRVVFADKKRERVMVIERPQSSRFLKGTLGFPTLLEGQNKAKKGREIGFFRHSITHHNIRCSVYCEQWEKADGNVENHRWIPVGTIEPMLVSNLDRKAWMLALKAID